jgi:hypothetical protein
MLKIRPHSLSLIISALFALHSAAFSQQQPYVPKGKDIVAVIYEFMLTPDGKAHDIKVAKVFWQKDQRDASDVLTDADKSRGAMLIATHSYHPRPDQVGVKRYDSVLFDAKSRQFNRGATTR